MAVLGGEFAVIMLVSGEKRSISGLIGSLEELEKESGLRIEIKPTIPQNKDENSIPLSAGMRIPGQPRTGSLGNPVYPSGRDQYRRS